MINRIFIFTIILTLSLWNLSAKDKSVIKEVTATYVSATVYTGYTGYFFKDMATGKEIQIQDVHEPGMVQVPINLLEDSKDLEGLPGANPKLVGKKFIIQYLKGNIIVVTRVK